MRRDRLGRDITHISTSLEGTYTQNGDPRITPDLEREMKELFDYDNLIPADEEACTLYFTPDVSPETWQI